MSSVTDYKPAQVQDRLVSVFRKRKGEATTADLVALTGLPKSQVDAELPAVADEFGARLRVTESGEILYSFPDGMKSRYRGFLPGLRRFWKKSRKAIIAAATFAFKAWIVVMLVGYFALFVALILIALLASIAISFAGKDERDNRSGGGLGGLWLAGRLIDAFVRIWFYSELFKTPEERYYRDRARYERKKDKKPLYKAIFSFVFGDGDPNADWDTVEKKAVVAFLQANKGIMTTLDFMAITGLPPAEAEKRINSYLLEFEGEPEVSEGGAIYYSFPALLRRKDRTDRTWGGSAPLKRLAAFSSNPAKANRWFAGLNGFNLLFGGYFLASAITVPTETVVAAARLALSKQPVPETLLSGFSAFYAFVNVLFINLTNGDPRLLLGIGLGAVPLVFSVLFYAIPAIRKARLAAANERVKGENLRKIAYRVIGDGEAGVRPEALGNQVASLDAARPADPRAPEKVLVELAAQAGGEPQADGSFAFPELARSQAEARAVRASTKDFDLGATVFDSHS